MSEIERTGSSVEPVFSTRISIQWDEDEEMENTSTWILAASNHLFVDARIDLKTGIPEWLMTGEEVELPAREGHEFSIQFKHELDSMNANPDESEDIADFNTLPSGDRLETGVMLNPASGKMSPYKEVWRTLDPVKSTPANLTRYEKGADQKPIKSTVWNLSSSANGASGRFITIGNFSQGIVKFNNAFQCIRIFNNEVIYQYGSNVEEIFGQFMKGLSTFNRQFPWEKLPVKE